MDDWISDKAKRAEPQMLTKLFHTSIPVLRFLDWQVTHTERGVAETLLPLNVESSNQHITHQAAIMMIAADYTGGIALGTLFDGVPLVGIHPQETDYGAYLWGAKADVKWIRPSTDDLQVVARIDPSRHEMIARRFFEGRRVLETVHVDLFNREGAVAEANFTYWVQDTYALRRNAFDENKIHPLYDHKRKTSAKLIAGLRGLEQQKPLAERLFVDDLAIAAAGKHGLTIAERFCMVAPQIQPMVAARTRHADDLVNSFLVHGPFQIINVGAGMDLRSYRAPLPKGTKVFDLDLPKMLQRRREEISALGLSRNPDHIQVPIDLLEHDIVAVISKQEKFDRQLPTLVVWEGGSMYFDKVMFKKIMVDCAKLLTHPQSRIWLDYVKNDVIDNRNNNDQVANFMNAIRALGEPFINGIDDIVNEMAAVGLKLEEDVPSGNYVDSDDILFSLYRFSVAKS